jgi:hypothetical protein
MRLTSEYFSFSFSPVLFGELIWLYSPPPPGYSPPPSGYNPPPPGYSPPPRSPAGGSSKRDNAVLFAPLPSKELSGVQELGQRDVP